MVARLISIRWYVREIAYGELGVHHKCDRLRPGEDELSADALQLDVGGIRGAYIGDRILVLGCAV